MKYDSFLFKQPTEVINVRRWNWMCFICICVVL